ncbi:MAG: alkaline phosphatase family protein [Thaumarchaeota archaeon]|nr:alkaline phosphatase family protein [Nitrososphaerota archaeon]
MAHKVLVIGLDGATWRVINQLISQGELPTLQRIIANGSSGTLTTIVPPLTPPAWVSSVTGVNPGKHNIYDFISHSNYKSSFVNATNMRAEPIWRILSRAGLRYVVINVPVTFPPDRNDNGVMISGMDAPSEKYQYTYPDSVKKKLDAIGYRIDCGGPTNFQGNSKRYLDVVLDTIDRRERVALDLMRSVSWDFFMVVETASDRVQHFYWKYFDTTYPNYDSSFRSRELDIIPVVYQRLDTMLDRLISTNDGNVNVFIISDHGFGPRTTDVYINNYLITSDFLSMKKVKVRSGFRRVILNVASIPIKLKIPLDFLIRFAPPSVINPFLLGGRFSLEDVDWSATKAIFLSYTGRSFLVNLKGREPQGIVDQKDYDRVRDDIILNIKNLTDPATGRKVVRSVYKKEEICKGNFVNNAPDLVLEMEDGYCAKDGLGNTIFTSPKAVLLSETGDHQPEGIILAYGPDVAQGRKIENASILDIVPTVLCLMNRPLPDYLDGKVLSDTLNETFRNSGKIIYEKNISEKDRIRSALAGLRSSAFGGKLGDGDKG